MSLSGKQTAVLTSLSFVASLGAQELYDGQYFSSL